MGQEIGFLIWSGEGKHTLFSDISIVKSEITELQSWQLNPILNKKLKHYLIYDLFGKIQFDFLILFFMKNIIPTCIHVWRYQLKKSK